jgi:hypothetical protein
MHDHAHGRTLLVALLLLNLAALVHLTLLMQDIASRLHGLGLGG